MNLNMKVFLILVPIFLAIDLFWLGIIMSGFYKSELGLLARRTGEDLAPIWWAAFLVYILIPLGIVLFALPRVPQDGSVASALGWGFIYGIILYGVYDFTNYSLVDKWPLRMTLVDIIWGGVICGLATVIASELRRWLA
jgi:uncharacterized membrane protein